MKRPVASVVIATRDRPQKLGNTLRCLESQTLPPEQFEVVIVDDGSSPPLPSPAWQRCPRWKLLRLEASGRSAARNAGARDAEGEILMFVDDDILVAPEFLSQHVAAHARWSRALVTGRIVLPPRSQRTPFGPFRQRLEDAGLPEADGPIRMPNLAAAGNMSIQRLDFSSLEGFDPALASGEDQDLALRHTEAGGQVVYLRSAEAIHEDHALDLRSYCRRAEWGAEHLARFCAKHPTWRDNVVRRHVNGPVRVGDPPSLTLRKLAKSSLGTVGGRALLFSMAALAERIRAPRAVLDRIYRITLGVHIQRGYRQGLRRHAAPSP